MSLQEVPEDVALQVALLLELADLPALMAASRGLHALLSKDSLWRRLCAREWRGKLYIPPPIQALAASQPKEALRLSWVDRRRKALTLEELCEFPWEFRFKLAAGPHLTSEDPFWNGAAARRVEFRADGTVHAQHYDFPRRWRWETRVLGKTVPEGACIRVEPFPPYVVSRHKKHWGWIMESCWVVFTSFPMSSQDEDILDDALKVSVDMQLADVYRYNYGVQD